MPRTKIFGIGLSKTGTTTLTQALEILGYSAVHFPRNFKEIEFFDAATDAPVADMFEALDAKFPGSKFIYTVRDREQWLRSCERYYSVRGRQPDDMGLALRRKFYGKAEFDRELFASGYRRHHERVLSHFENRPDDLLVLDICGKDAGWPPLCTFLGKPVPSAPFPMANKGVKVDDILLRLLHVVGDTQQVATIASVTPHYAESLYRSQAFGQHDPQQPLMIAACPRGDKILARCCRYLGGVKGTAAKLSLPGTFVREAKTRHQRRKLVKRVSRLLPLSLYWFMKRSGVELIR